MYIIFKVIKGFVLYVFHFVVLKPHFCSRSILLQESQKKVEELVQDKKAYQAARVDCIEWLQEAHQQLDNAQPLPSADKHSIDKSQHLIQTLQNNLDDGESKVNTTNHLGDKVVTRADPDTVATIETELAELNDSWKVLNNKVQDTSEHVDELQDKWHQYEELKSELVKWLAETEREVHLTTDPTTELVKKKVQLEKFKVQPSVFAVTKFVEMGLRIYDRINCWEYY